MTRADNTRFLTQATAERHHETLRKASDAIEHLDSTGQPVNFSAVAAAAGVSRDSPYRDPAILLDPNLGPPDGWLAARRTGCSASGHSRSQRPANALDLPVSARTRRDGPGCRSTGRSAVAAVRSAARTGLHVRSKRAAPRPRLRPALSGRRQGKSCSSAAGRVRPGAAGTSPPAISLAEHRVEFGVSPDRPDLLRAAAGDGDLGSPPQRLLA